MLFALCAFACSAGSDADEAVDSAQQALGPVTVGYTYDSNNDFVVTVTDPTATSAQLYCGATSMGTDSSAPFVWTVPASTCNGTSLGGFVYNGGSSQLFQPLVTLQQPMMAAGRTTNCFGYAGKAWCMGRGNYGQLGNGGTSDSNVPVQVGTSRTVVDMKFGYQAGCYRTLLSNQQVSCWGRNQYGITGQDPAVTSQANSPVVITNSNQGVVGLAVGDYHACLLRNDGTVDCWGRGVEGQLGNGGTSNSHTLVTASITNVVKIAAGGDTTCALRANADLYCWGRDDWGQAGNGGTAAAAVTTPALVMSTTVGVAVGYRHACAYSTSGAISCWGQNNNGQLMTGAADALTHVSPTATSYTGILTNVNFGRAYNSCVKQSSAIKCTGENTLGQMGNGTTSAYELTSQTPTGFTSLVASYSIGGDSALGFRAGHTYAWGDNTYGQLGDSTTTQRLSPTLIPGF